MPKLSATRKPRRWVRRGQRLCPLRHQTGLQKPLDKARSCPSQRGSGWHPSRRRAQRPQSSHTKHLDFLSYRPPRRVPLARVKPDDLFDRMPAAFVLYGRESEKLSLCPAIEPGAQAFCRLA